MRVLIVSAMTKTSQTGVTAHYNRLIEGLSDQVESVTLLTPADTPTLVRKTYRALGLLINKLGKTPRLFFGEFVNFVSISAAIWKHRDGQYDLVHAQDVNSGAAAAFVLGRKTRVIATCHFNDDPLTEYGIKYRLRPWVRRWLSNWYSYLFRQHNGFIPVSDYIKTTSARLRPADVPCTVIHNSVQFSTPKPKPAADVMTILNIGTVEERKNQRLLIEAAEQLVARGFTQFKVRFFGDGPKRAEWQQLIDQKGLGAYVVFEGFRTDVAEQLAGTSLYVHTARNESWGYSITEAIASGTPVLALATGGIPEQFDPNRPGLLPVNTSAAELAEAILANRSEQQRNRLAEVQFRFASKRFSLKVMTDKHIQFYEQVLEGQIESQPAETIVNA